MTSTLYPGPCASVNVPASSVCPCVLQCDDTLSMCWARSNLRFINQTDEPASAEPAADSGPQPTQLLERDVAYLAQHALFDQLPRLRQDLVVPEVTCTQLCRHTLAQKCTHARTHAHEHTRKPVNVCMLARTHMCMVACAVHQVRAAGSSKCVARYRRHNYAAAP